MSSLDLSHVARNERDMWQHALLEIAAGLDLDVPALRTAAAIFGYGEVVEQIKLAAVKAGGQYRDTLEELAYARNALRDLSEKVLQLEEQVAGLRNRPAPQNPDPYSARS